MERRKGSNTWVSVYEFVGDKIIEGAYCPGEKLNEREIAQLTNVSRTPTREALRILEYEGFVTNISKKGVFVKKYLPEELDTLHRMLMRLERLAVEMALPKLSRNDITNLQNITRRLGALASKRDYGEYLTLNTEFHLFFPRRSGSGELLETISQLRKRIFRFAYSQVIADHETQDYLRDHQEIIDALMNKTHGNPEKIMERHVDRSRRSFLNFYRKLGLLGT